MDLSEPLSHVRCVSWDPYIYCIGGLGPLGSTKKMHVINTLSNKVYVATERLVISAFALAPIIVGERLYAFGSRADTFQYIDITPSPTLSPTDTTTNPTAAPSDPTTYPSTNPTANPTQPTQSPSQSGNVNESLLLTLESK